MPRTSSARNTSKAPTGKKRATKRGTLNEDKIYELGASPSSLLSLKDETKDLEIPCDQEETISEAKSSISSSVSGWGRCQSTSSTTVADESDTTPTQPKPFKAQTMSVESKTSSIPGFEALEAVNGLYQQLKDIQAEVDRLQFENRQLSLEARTWEKRVENVQCELKSEKEKTKKVQQAHEKESGRAKRDAEEKLSTVVESLRSFSPAAHSIMPLLDLITDGAEIEYDDATEKLYQVLKTQQEKDK